MGAIIAAPMPLASGTRLSQYEILSPIGAGSMGEVYRARDTRLERDVAIKVLPQLVLSEPERLQRFEVEAKAAAALNHPNILAVYQMGTYAGVPYLVSELLEGMTLAETVRRGGAPRPPRASKARGAGAAAVAQGDRLRSADCARPGSGPRKRNRPSRPQARQPIRHQRRACQDSGLRAGEGSAAEGIPGEYGADVDHPGRSDGNCGLHVSGTSAGTGDRSSH